jgi:hypothetical protein
MAESTAESLRVALDAVETLLASLEPQVKAAIATRAQILELLATLESKPAEPASVRGSEETAAKAAPEVDDSRRLSLVDRLVHLIVESAAGTTWKAKEFAIALYESAPTTSQVEGVRTYARRLVDRGLLVKNDDGSFTKVEVAD